jgi:RNA polymerase primary sigma factor
MQADQLLEDFDPLFTPEPESDLLEGKEEEDLAEPAEIEEEEEEFKAAKTRSDEPITIYLREIQKTKLLTAPEERALAALVAQGDKAAREKMIVSNLRLVVNIAKRYMNRGLPFLDLIEEGNLGLIKAVERFELEKECRFSTYATWRIRQSIERALVNQSRTIRLPVHVSDAINRMIRVSRELAQKQNREPTVAEVAERLEVDVEEVRRLMVLLKKTFSIERPLGESNDFFLIDTIEDHSTVSPAKLQEELNSYELVARWFDELLNENEKRVLTLRFGLNDEDPQTLDSIGRSFGVTRERIRQIESKSLQKLRKLLTVEGTRQRASG